MIKNTVQSKTNMGTTYQVFLSEKGWHCTCPQFLFREKKVIYCKHILEVLQQLEQLLITHPNARMNGFEVYQRTAYANNNGS